MAEVAAPDGAATGYSALDPCVHCGFCLPACPTYLATGDEADSPRGRIVLMRALERGELGAGDPALAQHLDACLGCRGCEPACPSGVGYGRGLEAAREQLFNARGLPPLARLVLAIFRRRALWRPIFMAARLARSTGVPARAAGAGRVGFAMGMLAATRGSRIGAHAPSEARSGAAQKGTGAPATNRQSAPPRSLSAPRPHSDLVRPSARPSVALFRGCVMDTLFAHVHAATRRVLEANGYRVIEVQGQACCGALHEHAGDRAGAEALARANLAAFTAGSAETDFVAVNSAGCGALLKDCGHLLGTDKAERMAARVRDVSELLAEAGPRRGAPLPIDVAYDAPCHLQHAQRVHAAPLAVLGAIPELRLRVLPGSDRCCGSAGIYSLLHPALARDVLAAKIASIREAEPPVEVVASGNPGCLMQIGAGLRAAGLPVRVAHPVELLDASYAKAAVA
ncbi:MAG TPA: heterodisulfide reductase-related iron-sulfur binding cluster [Gemmatimonadales bacterium]|nr:heterodisulfide reductase-related iron-sulfur binding cluster [Gemmatimonadales bacterium]